MNNYTGQFKATNLYNCCLNELSNTFCDAKFSNLSGNDIFTQTMNYFINNGRTEVNEDKIMKFCQILLDTEEIYLDSTNVPFPTHFSMSPAVKYRMCAADKIMNYSKPITRSKSIISIEEKRKALIKKLFWAGKNETTVEESMNMDTNEEMETNTNCIERKVTLARLLKILDLSMIQNLIDLLLMSPDCDHQSPFTGKFQCDYFNGIIKLDVQINNESLFNIHYNCLIRHLEKNRRELNQIKKCSYGSVNEITYNKFLNLLTFFADNPDILRWKQLAEVFCHLCNFIEYRTRDDLVICGLQLSLSLLPTMSFHLTAHLFMGLKLVFLDPTDNEHKVMIQKIANSLLPDSHLTDNYNKRLVFIYMIQHCDQLFNLPTELVNQIEFMKNMNADPETFGIKKVNPEVYKAVTNEATERALRELYQNLQTNDYSNRLNNQNWSKEFQKTHGNVFEKLKK